MLLDAPCSCFGTLLKHPDVFLSRDENDLKDIALTQKNIAKNAVRYLKNGGVMIYSTCTLFDEENGEAVKSITENKGFKLEKIVFENKALDDKFKDNEGEISVMPKGEYDGFFIAKIRREND